MSIFKVLYEKIAILFYYQFFIDVSIIFFFLRCDEKQLVKQISLEFVSFIIKKIHVSLKLY